MSDIDSILESFKATPGASSGDPMLQMMMMQMQQDRADRAAARQNMLNMVTALAPLVLPVLLKKEADPVLMTVLQGLMAKSNDTEQFRTMMAMMQSSSQMSMDQMKTAMLSIMETKDTMHRKALEDAMERGADAEPASGPAAILKELRLGISGIAGMVASAPSAPAPAIAAPAANPSAGGAAPMPPIAVILHRLRAIQTGQIKATPAAWAALSTVALQDPALIQAIDDCGEDDLQPLLAYCAPHIQGDPALLAWISGNGVAQWVDAQVQQRLLPLIDAARDDGSVEDPAGDEPETLTAESVAAVAPTAPVARPAPPVPLKP